MRVCRFAFFMVALLSSSASYGQSWHQWRGPQRNGTVASFTAPNAWPSQLTRQWKIDVGPGYATPLIDGDRIYVFARQGENEVMSALKAASGEKIWTSEYPASFRMNGSTAMHGPGPKSTPALSNGRLFSIGMTGVVSAYDAATGKVLWRHPGSPVVPVFTTHSFSPLVDGNRVIFHVGGNNDGALTAYDVATGEIKWSWKGDGPGYGSPIVAELGGTRQIVTITQAKLVGVDAATGELLWELPYATRNSTNSITPLLHGQTIIAGGTHQALIAVQVQKQGQRWVPQVLWENSEVTMRMTNGVIVRDILFSLSTKNSGQYFSADVKTGKTLWLSEPRQAENASLLLAGGLIFSLEDDGELVIFQPGFQPGSDALQALHRYKLADTDTWTAPVIVGRRMLVKDVSTLSLWSWE